MEPTSLSAALHEHFVRVFLSLSLMAMILVSSEFSTVRALPSVSKTTNGGAVIQSNSSRRSVVDNSTAAELRASSPSQIVHRGEHRRASSYVREALRRQQQQHLQVPEEKRKRAVVNLRKLSSQFGCLANVTMCLTVPGWTAASKASTCCSTGLCTDTQFDGLNCGACGKTCSLGYFCCSGVCVATATDPKNCGGCATKCSTGGVCAFGFCGGY